MSRTIGDGPLPVPPLIKIIAAYATVQPLTVTTAVGEDRVVALGFADGIASLSGPRRCVLWKRPTVDFFRPSKTSFDTSASTVGTKTYSDTNDSTVDLLTGGVLAEGTRERLEAAQAGASAPLSGRARDWVLLFTEDESKAVRCLDLNTYELSLFPGSGSTEFSDASGIAVCSRDNSIWISQRTSNQIYRMAADGSGRELVAGHAKGESGFGDNAKGAQCLFHAPCGIAASRDGSTVLVADRRNHRIRLISTTAPYPVRTLAGDGRDADVDTDPLKPAACGGSLSHPLSVVYEPSQSENENDETVAYVFTLESDIRRIDLLTEMMSTIPCRPRIAGASNGIFLLPPPPTTADERRLARDRMLVTSYDSIHTVDLRSGRTERLVGTGRWGVPRNGTALKSGFDRPLGMAYLSDPNGNGADRLYVLDSENHQIRVVTGAIQTSALAPLPDENDAKAGGAASAEDDFLNFSFDASTDNATATATVTPDLATATSPTTTSAAAAAASKSAAASASAVPVPPPAVASAQPPAVLAAANLTAVADPFAFDMGPAFEASAAAVAAVADFKFDVPDFSFDAPTATANGTAATGAAAAAAASFSFDNTPSSIADINWESAGSTVTPIAANPNQEPRYASNFAQVPTMPKPTRALEPK